MLQPLVEIRIGKPIHYAVSNLYKRIAYKIKKRAVARQVFGDNV